MYKNILIDHTLLHSIWASDATSKNYKQVQIRELLKFIEALLLPDNIYTANLVNQNTLSISEDFFEILYKNELMNASSTGIFRYTPFSFAQKKDICKASAPKVYEIVKKWDFTKIVQIIGNLSQEEHNKYLIRPKGAKKLDFISLAKVKYDSQEAIDLVEEYIRESGWGTTATMFLINPDLHMWLQKITTHFPDKKHIAYSTLNTISRWQINETTAMFLNRENNHDYLN